MPRSIVRWFSIASALLVSAVSAYGQNASFNALFQGADPKGEFNFTWKEQEPGKFSRPVGRLGWEVPPSEFSTGGMDRSFSGYCSEPLVPVVAGNLYRYQIQSPEMPEIYGLKADETGVNLARRRATYVRELFGRYYFSTLKSTDSVTPLAFQAALWEVIHESEFPEVAAPFNLFTGNFRANYPSPAESPAFVQQAQQYLASLTGDDLSTFYDNTAVAGKELVHMKGIATDAGLVGQSQFGLRDPGAGGGAPGFNGATANGGNGFGGLGGSNFGGLGSGGGGITPGIFGGGGGGIGGGGNSGGGSSNPNTTPPSTTPPTVITPPTTGDGGGGSQPNTPNEPVPAPAGILLGAIAFGVIAGRRAILRHKS